jgi:hypothetical protein
MHETRNAPMMPDHAKCAGCNGVAGTMQFGMTDPKVAAIRTSVRNSLPANQSFCDVLVVMGRAI